MVAGPSCLVAFVFLSLISRAFLPGFDLAFENQLPLTATSDAGLAAAIVLSLAILPKLQRAAKGYAFALCATGACLSTLAKMGILGGVGAATLIAGDALAAFFCATCLILWWETILSAGDVPPQQAIASIGLAGAVLFFPFALMPASLAGIAGAIVLPFASCVCFAPFVDAKPNARAVEAPAEGQKQGKRMPRILALIVVLTFVTVDPILDLFPTNLFYDGPAAGSLCLPGALCAGIFAAMAGAALVLSRNRELPLAALYIPAFALAVFGFLLSPYRPITGIPLGAAETGRGLACAFVMCVALRIEKGNPTRQFTLTLKAGLLACVVAFVCDAAVIALQLTPGFDYSDFVFRTTFSAVCIVALVALLLGPLPRLEVALTAVGDSAKPADAEQAAPQPIAIDVAQQRAQLVEQFAQAHGLTARETEVFSLIAAGRDVPYIERELVLAKSTVKTHVKHIYAKCSVSSKQDLLDKLEAFSK